MNEDIDFEAICAACTYYQTKFPSFFKELDKISQLPEFKDMHDHVHYGFCVRYCPVGKV